jgi:uncharacterized protein
MESTDVNVLVNAMRRDAVHHDPCRAWLDSALADRRPIGISELALSGAVRIVTNVAAFKSPLAPYEAFEFADTLLAHPAVTRLRPGEAHWRIFRTLTETSHATGSRVADAYHAALAMEHGATWVTLDRDFLAFPGLKVRHLLSARPDEVHESRPRYSVSRPRRRAASR